MKVVIFAQGNIFSQNSILKQLQICENYALFYDYEVIGIATEVETLFKINIEYDAVLAMQYNMISGNAGEYQRIKMGLLKRGIIIISAMQSK